jgi:hypothetical protein
MSNSYYVTLEAVVLAVTAEAPRVLVREEHSGWALPSGPFEPERFRTLELALRELVQEQTGLSLGYVEQLYTFGNRFRDPRERWGSPRRISVAYLALVRQSTGSAASRWLDVYAALPWEDWRSGRPQLVEEVIPSKLAPWLRAGDARERKERRERMAVVFGQGTPWDPERVLERYELLYEAGLVAESVRDQNENTPGEIPPQTFSFGTPLCLDHRRILASALGRLRGKLTYRPVVFELLPPTFTLLELQKTVEALAGQRVHKQNFRRLVEEGGLVEPTKRVRRRTGGRPARLYRFRREVLLERPAPGVGLPGARVVG